MKLARPYRMPPLRIAEAIAAELAAEAGDARLADRRRWPSPRPASSTCGWPTRPRRPRRGRARRARRLGPRPGGRPAPRQRRVRLREPDRAPPHRQRPRRLRRRPPLPRPRGGRPRGHARVLLQRLRGPGAEPRRRRSSRSAAATAIPEDGYRGAYVHDLAPRDLPADVGRPRRPPGTRRRRRGARDAAWIVGEWASERVRAGIEASLATPRRPLRRLEERGLALPRGLGRAGGRAPARLGPPLRAGRRALVPLDRLRRRQGPGRPQVERRLHLLRLRHRLRRREVQPRLRPPRLHLGRRPPRDGGPAAERRGGDGLRPRGGPDDPHGLGPLRPRRRRGLDVEAGRRVHHPRRAARRRSGSTRRAGSSPPAGHTSGIDFDIELAKKQSNENPVYYVQYAHARIASILRKAAEAGLEPGAGVAPGSLGGRRHARGRAGPGAGPLPRGRRGRGGRRGDAGRDRLRDRARDAVPRLLPRRAGGRPGGAGALAVAPRPRPRGPAHACRRARPPGDLGARSRCRTRGGRVRPSDAEAAGRPRRRLASDRPPSFAANTQAERSSRAALDAGCARQAPRPRSPPPRRTRRRRPACPTSWRAPARRPRPGRAGRRGGRRPSPRPRRRRVERLAPRSRAARPRAGTRRACPPACRDQPAPIAAASVVGVQRAPRPASRRPRTSPGGGPARSSRGAAP